MTSFAMTTEQFTSAWLDAIKSRAIALESPLSDEDATALGAMLAGCMTEEIKLHQANVQLHPKVSEQMFNSMTEDMKNLAKWQFDKMLTTAKMMGGAEEAEEAAKAEAAREAAPEAAEAAEVAKVAKAAEVAEVAEAAEAEIVRDANGLQISGAVDQGVILQFFKKSNTLFAQQSVKDDFASAYTRGENIYEILKSKQESVWASFSVKAEFGFKTIETTLNSKTFKMSEEFREQLVEASQMETNILTYALLGSQEKFEEQQARMASLMETAQLELQSEMQRVHGNVKLEQVFTQQTMEQFETATAGFEALDEIGRLKKQQQLSDEEYKAIVKGNCLQQWIAQQESVE